MNPLRWLTGRRTSEREVVDLTSRRHKEDPYPFYARMRAEEPVKRVTLPDGRAAFLVARYDDVAAVLRDERFVKDKRNAVKSKQPWMPAMFRPLMENMLDLDPPNHTRLRALVHKAFTPRLVEQMRPRVEALADGILDGLHGRAGFDLIRDYALPIPTAIITDMLGVPDRDRRRFHRWTRAIVSANPSGPGMLLVAPHVWAFLRFIRRLIRAKRSSPGDDLLSALVRAEEVGDQLSENELVAMAFLLLVAGHETTVNLIGNGVLALLEHPEQLERLRSDPAIIKPAVEELLRYASPLETATERYASEEVVVAGTTIPAGVVVLAAIASANRDGMQFPEPDTLILHREPNRHLSFGLGLHFCLGASLARMEGQVAINSLLRRAEFRAAFGRVRWRRGLVLRGVESLPLEVFKWR